MKNRLNIAKEDEFYTGGEMRIITDNEMISHIYVTPANDYYISFKNGNKFFNLRTTEEEAEMIAEGLKIKIMEVPF